MKIYAIVVDEAAVEVQDGAEFFTKAEDGSLVRNLPGALANYSAEEREERGIYELDTGEPPEGEELLGYELALEAGVPVLSVEFGVPPEAPPPPEVAMHRAHKAMMFTPWGADRNFGEEGGDLYDATLRAIDALPAPSNKLARAEFLRAPNIVREGQTTINVAALLGMTEEEKAGLFILAATLP